MFQSRRKEELCLLTLRCLKIQLLKKVVREAKVVSALEALTY